MRCQAQHPSGRCEPRQGDHRQGCGLITTCCARPLRPDSRTLIVPGCWENRRHTCPAQSGLHDDHHVSAIHIFPDGDLPRGASGHLPVLHVRDRHRGRAGPPLPQALIVVYAFHFPHLLSPQIAHSAHRTLYRRHILGVILPGPALCSAAAGFSLFCYPVSYLLMAAVIFLPYVSKAAGWGRARLGGRCRAGLALGGGAAARVRGPPAVPPPGPPAGPREPPAHSLEVFTFDLHEPLSKERVEAFSDGVYAIVATLLILDICEDNVPDAKDVKEKFQGSLVAALGASGPHFLAYFGSFATVGLLWFSHHSLFLHIRKATRPMGLLNTLSLAFVGGLPLAYQQTSAFARQPRDELESVRVSCAIIFLASIFQFAIWTTALLQEGETLQPSARFGGREHAFMFAKLALYPCASLLAFTCTCVLSRFSTAIFHAMQIAVPFTFLLLRLLVRLALAGLRGLRGLALPAQARPARGAVDGARSPLLPAPC
ncbi:endosomal/lysosomal proton channel TMEM175 isoform X4 [Hippopotamus amphibius kiboko]|uniref:endosomal/lysosomal proton channel TMEM175 isoform X4 n=1 Tax=Hippopotamus amphibius kiboko TaxID=575201 RepID=UPI002597D229|nr:endosomal/lysosomal proton channel TMEM175 isoform X4 [Hippopotamus amphibius kiboko]